LAWSASHCTQRRIVVSSTSGQQHMHRPLREDAVFFHRIWSPSMPCAPTFEVRGHGHRIREGNGRQNGQRLAHAGDGCPPSQRDTDASYLFLAWSRGECILSHIVQNDNITNRIIWIQPSSRICDCMIISMIIILHP